MTNKLLWGFLSMILVLPLSITSCEMIPSKNIATVESVSFIAGLGGSGIEVYLKPTSDAKAFTSYTVDLYESGRFRASKIVFWNNSELKIFTNKEVMFPIPIEEVGPYIDAGKKMEDVFTVKMYETPKTTSSPTTTKPQNTLSTIPSTTDYPSVTIISPNGGEVWHIGDKIIIRWTSVNYTDNIYVQLSYDSGKTWVMMIPQTGNTGSQEWTVSGETSNHCRIKIFGVGNNPTLIPEPVMSAADFIISR